MKTLDSSQYLVQITYVHIGSWRNSFCEQHTNLGPHKMNGRRHRSIVPQKTNCAEGNRTCTVAITKFIPKYYAFNNIPLWLLTFNVVFGNASFKLQISSICRIVSRQIAPRSSVFTVYLITNLIWLYIIQISKIKYITIIYYIHIYLFQ
jgi:hypothetical protein